MESDLSRVRRLLPLLAAGALLWLLRGRLFSTLWPLLTACLLSALIRRPAEYLARKRILSLPAAAGLLTLTCLLLWGGACWLLLSLGIYGLQQLTQLLPVLLEGLQGFLTMVAEGARALRERLPLFLRQAPLLSPEALTAWLTPEQLGLGRLLGRLSHAAVSLPQLGFSLVFLFVATYYLTVDRQSIGEFFHRQLTVRQSLAVMELKSYLGKSVAGWLRAQAILIGVTFCLLLAGFLLLRVPYALALAALTAALDALPVLGVGAVLLPWALWQLLTGAGARAAGLVLLYAAILGVRHSLEPRLVSRGLDLPPFVTLLCLYFGFRLAGLPGMFLLPLGMLALIRLRDWGYLRLWK